MPTAAANEGIRAVPDEHLLVRDDADGIAEAVIGLLRDGERRRAMGRAARDFVSAHWTWEAHFEQLEKVLRESLAQNQNPLPALPADARDVAAPAVAVISLPQRVPFGFHGNWVSDASVAP